MLNVQVRQIALVIIIYSVFFAFCVFGREGAKLPQKFKSPTKFMLNLIFVVGVLSFIGIESEYLILKDVTFLTILISSLKTTSFLLPFIVFYAFLNKGESWKILILHMPFVCVIFLCLMAVYTFVAVWIPNFNPEAAVETARANILFICF